MNKYKLALDKWWFNRNSRTISEEELEELKKPLQELVDKETPKKIVYRPITKKLEGNEKYILVCCPNCDCSFGFKWEHEVNSYCKYCGQALDWSEDE